MKRKDELIFLPLCFNRWYSVIHLQVLKTRLSLRTTGQYRGIADAARKMYGREGFQVFFRGYLPNLLGIIPYAGIDLAIYEVRAIYWPIHPLIRSTFLRTFSVTLIKSDCNSLSFYQMNVTANCLPAFLFSYFHTKHMFHTISRFDIYLM